jgi:hypothetical protein
MRILVIILIVYLAFRLLVNYILPLVLRFAVQKAARNMQGGPFRTQAYQTDRRREGEVRIENPQATSRAREPRRSKSDDTGEYVDFTEIK